MYQISSFISFKVLNLVQFRQVSHSQAVYKKLPLKIKKRQLSPTLFQFDKASDKTISVKQNLKIGNKTFISTAENNHFHSVLKSKTIYHKYLAFDPPCDNVDMKHLRERIHSVSPGHSTLTEKLELLRLIGTLTSEDKEILFSDKILSNVIEDFLNILPDLSHDQFTSAMKSFGTLDLRDIVNDSHNQLQQLICRRINLDIGRECVKRADLWNIETLLIAADLFFTLHSKYIFNLPYAMIFWKRMENLCTENKISQQDAVAILFHVNLERQLSRNMRDNLINPFLDGIPNDFSLDECALVCAGFHKSKHPVNSKTFNRDTIFKIINDIHTADEISICAIFKSFSRTFDKGAARYHPEAYLAMIDLTHHMAERFDTLSLMSVVRIVKFYHDILLTSEKMQQAFINKIKNTDFSTIRSKELSKISFLLGSLMLKFDGYQEILNAITLELMAPHQRYHHEETHLHNIVRSLTGMSMLNYYPESMVDSCFSSTILNSIDKIRTDTGRMLFTIDQSMRIERPSYTGNLLRKSANRIRKPKLDLPDLSGRGKLLTDLSQKLTRILGGRQFFDVCVLQHFVHADFEIYFNDQGAVPIMNSRTNHQMDSEKLKRVVICVHGENSFYRVIQDDGSDQFQLGGRFHIRQRQLERLCHKVIPINEFEYKEAEDKEMFLTELLSNNVDCFKKKITTK